jgi:hypothetical protein
MMTFSRRQFLKSLGAASAVLLTDRAGLPFSTKKSDIEILVVGDSLIWGQGLLEKDKFYTLTKDALQTKLQPNVNLKVKAHSGAPIFLSEKEELLLRNAKLTGRETYHPEVNVSFPSLRHQIDNARDEYIKDGKSAEDVNLVMLSGGIVDISVAGLLNPFGKDLTLSKLITRYCRDSMIRFLNEAAAVFPNALFVVVGYFPIVSPETDTGKMLNSFLEAFSIPRPLKPVANNILMKQFFKPVQKTALKRSRRWFAQSNEEFQQAVNTINQSQGKQRAIFVKSPLTEAHAMETPETKLFRMGKKGRVEDFLTDERKAACNETLKELKREIGLKQSIRQCEMAGIAHPDVNGSKAYAEAIVKSLENITIKTN